tara:strand:+ start:191 stop:886 length:696 start_codon:yes stop_codon:yes gene_type:complete
MQYNENFLPFQDLQKIYCINVAENVQRREFMEMQFKLLEIDPSIIEFVDAVTPTSPEFRKQKRRAKLQYKNKIACAISLSHRKIWEDIKENKYYGAMVLEDGIEFNIAYLKGLKKKISLYDMRDKRYFIHLLTSYPEKILEQHSARNRLEKMNIKYGVGAYVISHKAAFMLCRDDLFFPIKEHVDDYVWSIKRSLSFKQQYAFLPFICQNASQPKTKCFPQQIYFFSSFNT